MQLIDVHQEALQKCNDSLSIIQSTNEFYNNRISSNGVVYSLNLHSCAINGAFLSLFMAFEHYLECSFICYMMGQSGINGNRFSVFVNPQSEENAINILKGINRFPDFTNRDTIVKLASNLFSNGGPYVYLNAINADFADMKSIRNAITHISIESIQSFQRLVRTKLGSLPPHFDTSLFLNTMIPNNTKTFFMHYRDIVIGAIDHISNP